MCPRCLLRALRDPYDASLNHSATHHTTTPHPLASRDADIPKLARHFLEAAAPEKRLSTAAEAALRRYDWPGNVRELKHRIEAAALFSGAVVEPRDLALDHLEIQSTQTGDLESQLWSLVTEDGCSLSEAMTHCERLLVRAALDAESNNRTRAAQRLGIHVRTIFKKLASEPSSA